MYHWALKSCHCITCMNRFQRFILAEVDAADFYLYVPTWQRNLSFPFKLKKNPFHEMLHCFPPVFIPVFFPPFVLKLLKCLISESYSVSCFIQGCCCFLLWNTVWKPCKLILCRIKRTYLLCLTLCDCPVPCVLLRFTYVNTMWIDSLSRCEN